MAIKTMLDLDWKEIGSTQELILDQDLILDDHDFSDKQAQIARKGDKVTLKHCQDYGLIKHPIYGFFRC